VGRAEEEGVALANRAAAQAALDNPDAVALLLGPCACGAEEQGAALVARDPAAHGPVEVTRTLGRLLEALRSVA